MHELVMDQAIFQVSYCRKLFNLVHVSRQDRLDY